MGTLLMCFNLSFSATYIYQECNRAKTGSETETETETVLELPNFRVLYHPTHYMKSSSSIRVLTSCLCSPLTTSAIAALNFIKTHHALIHYGSAWYFTTWTVLAVNLCSIPLNSVSPCDEGVLHSVTPTSSEYPIPSPPVLSAVYPIPSDPPSSAY